MSLFFITLSVVFYYYSKRLLLSLLLLETLSFTLVSVLCLNHSEFFITESVLLVVFAIFVIEGVIAISGLISLVSFTGSDYVRSFSFFQL